MLATTIPTQKSLPVFVGQRILCWFSCGAASAVATKETLDAYASTNRVLPVYCDTAESEHPDNERFLAECEQWFGSPILRIQNSEFTTVEQVFEAKRYMSGVAGACCTAALKKVPRLEFAWQDDIHVFGFTSDKKERKRAIDFWIRNFELRLLWILQDRNVTKQNCFDRLAKAGIELPEMYKLGYDHNNCIACVKATSAYYWDKTRTDFPEKFAERARQSREIGCRLARLDGKRIFLDELPTDRVFKKRKENLSCGPECGRK